jgi:hypothetical protein
MSEETPYDSDGEGSVISEPQQSKKGYVMTEKRRLAFLRCMEGRRKKLEERHAEKERIKAQTSEEKAQKRKLTKEIREKHSLTELKQLSKPVIKQRRTQEDDDADDEDAPVLQFDIDYDEIAKQVAARLAKQVKIAPPRPLKKPPPPQSRFALSDGVTSPMRPPQPRSMPQTPVSQAPRLTFV